jgi:hypothetical protein
MNYHAWPAKIFLVFLLLTLAACSTATPTPTSPFGGASGTRTFNRQPTATETETPAPTLTPTPVAPTLTPSITPTITPFPTATSLPVACNAAEYAGSVNWPDGSLVAPGYQFTKKWMLKNTGSCTWTTGYAVVFVSGTKMGSVTAVNLPVAVAPNQIVTVSVPLTAPLYGGVYTSYWMLRSDSNQIFGVGLTRDQPFWVQVRLFNIITPTPTP